MPSFEVRAPYASLLRRSAQQPCGTYLSATLSNLILASSLITAAITVWIVIHSYTPVLHWDQWGLIARLIESHGRVTGSLLWTQNNEHRDPIGMLLGLADLFWFGGRNKSLLIEMFAVLALHAGVLTWTIKRFGRLDPVAFVSAAGVVAYCIFSPLPIQNLTWGFQVPFVSSGCAASLCFAAALWYAEFPERPSRNYVFAVCLIAALLCELSLANGLLIWPMLFGLGVVFRFSRRDLLVILTAGTAAIAVYFAGYHSTPGHANPAESIRHPFHLLKFGLTCLAFTWDGHLPNTSAWPVLSESVALLAVLAAGAGTVQCFRHRPARTRFEAFLFANMMFALGSIALTALGRINFGYEQAIATRYQSFALMFWVSLGLLILTKLGKGGFNSRQFVLFQAAILVLFLSSGPRFTEAYDWAMGHKFGLARGYDELRGYGNGESAIVVVYPDIRLARAYSDYLTKHGWGPKPASLLAYPTVEPSNQLIEMARYRTVDSSECSGSLDGAAFASDFGVYRAGGWAWDAQNHSLPSAVGLVSTGGKIAGFATLGGSRPDVPGALPGIKNSNTGWNGEFELADGQTYRAFAVLKDGRSACFISNQLIIARKSPVQ